MVETRFEPVAVRYIKLGPGGAWATQAIADGTLPLGFTMIGHQACLDGDWEEVRRQWVASGKKPSSAGQTVRELMDFYQLGEDALWVTIADGHLWWAFAKAEVEPLGDPQEDRPSRLRRVRGGWCRQSLTGERLTTRTLSSALTKTATYRRTICKVEAEDYLLRRIRGEDDPLHAEAVALQGRMRDLGRRLIKQLHWAEFETLIDLIFARNGWRRSSLLGESLPDIDLIVEQPVTGETAWVQVKTGTRQAELDDYLGRFRRDGSCQRFFFACHSPAGPLQLPDEPGLHLWAGEGLAAATIEAGLFDWLVARTR